MGESRDRGSEASGRLQGGRQLPGQCSPHSHVTLPGAKVGQGRSKTPHVYTLQVLSFVTLTLDLAKKNHRFNGQFTAISLQATSLDLKKS